MTVEQMIEALRAESMMTDPVLISGPGGELRPVDVAMRSIDGAPTAVIVADDVEPAERPERDIRDANGERA